jgi:putative iron-only hydrogenase system regulator
MNKRLGFLGIIIEDNKNVAPKVNNLLTEFSNIIVARQGIPYKDKNCSVITLVIDSDTDTLGKLTGKLGGLEGVSVKSALSKNK